MRRLQLFKNDDEPICITPREIRKVPRSLEEIVRLTKFSKSEIRLLYKGFKQECPSGAVTEREFQTIYGHFFPHGKCQNYSRFLFRLLDRRKRLYFTFEDYIQTLSILVRGNSREKIQWIFRFYDIHDEGKLTRENFETILRSLYDLLGTNSCIHQPITEETVQKHSTLLFERLDQNGTGCVNFDDFENYCLHNEQIMKSVDFLSSNAV